MIAQVRILTTQSILPASERGGIECVLLPVLTLSFLASVVAYILIDLVALHSRHGVSAAALSRPHASQHLHARRRFACTRVVLESATHAHSTY